MRRNILTPVSSHNKLNQQKQCLAFHEAGHSTAIYINNKARNLPPVFFQIILSEVPGTADHAGLICQLSHDGSAARVEGGRLIQSLPYSVDGLPHKLIDHNEVMAPLVKDYIVAFEADIINLLVGPLAEARYVHERDDELFNHRLVNWNSVENYGGGSDLVLIHEYIGSFSANRQQQDEKLDELFTEACDFVCDSSNWKAITKLAKYISESEKDIISCEEVVSLLQS
jgi:hypothetical protein